MNFVKILAAAIAVSVLMFGLGYMAGDIAGSNAEKVRSNKAIANAYEKAQERVTKIETVTNRAIADKQTEFERVQHENQATVANLRNAVRSGSLRLSIPTNANCAATEHAGTPPGTEKEERTELLPQTADDLITLAADANNEVRRTNLCIDSYNTVLRLMKPESKAP